MSSIEQIKENRGGAKVREIEKIRLRRALAYPLAKSLREVLLRCADDREEFESEVLNLAIFLLRRPTGQADRDADVILEHLELIWQTCQHLDAATDKLTSKSGSRDHSYLIASSPKIRSSGVLSLD